MELLNSHACLRQRGDFLLNAPVGIEDSRVIAPAEDVTDLCKRTLVILTQQIHSDVASIRDIACARWPDDLGS